MIFNEFDAIHASDEMKQKTLHAVVNHRKKKKAPIILTTLACISCLFLVIAQPWKMWQEPIPPIPAVYSYVTIDINPSMEWKLDEQQNIVEITAYNQDANDILKQLELEGTSLKTALDMLLENKQFSSYMKKGFLEVSVYSEDDVQCQTIQNQINQQLSQRMSQQQFHCTKLAASTHQNAQKQHMSAGKYRVIQEILAYDDTKQIEDLQPLNMRQLYTILEKYNPSLVPEGCNGQQKQHGHRRHNP